MQCWTDAPCDDTCHNSQCGACVGDLHGVLANRVGPCPRSIAAATETCIIACANSGAAITTLARIVVVSFGLVGVVAAVLSLSPQRALAARPLLGGSAESMCACVCARACARDIGLGCAVSWLGWRCTPPPHPPLVCWSSGLQLVLTVALPVF